MIVSNTIPERFVALYELNLQAYSTLLVYFFTESLAVIRTDFQFAGEDCTIWKEFETER